MVNSKAITKLISVFSLSVLFISCGSQKPMVQDVQVSTEYVDSDLFLSVGANLSIGNVTLPQTTLPIYMPKSWQEIGSVSMTSAIGGNNYMEIDVNISAIAQLEASRAQLPNGSILPLIANNKVISIPVGSKGAQLYLTLADGVAALGTAIPFKTFDAMGSKIGTSSLFPVFNIEGVLGAAGIYTSRQAGKNGFGLFVDLSSVIDPIDFVDIGSSQSGFSHVAQKQVEGASLNYSSIKPSRRKEKRLNREMYKLHRRRKRLRLH